MKYVIDAYAWIEYFIGGSKGEKVKEIIESPENEIFTSIITLAEVISVIKRNNGNAEEKYLDIMNLSNLHDISAEFSKDVGIAHASIKSKIKDFGLADAFVLFTARKIGAKIITGDPHFKEFKEAIII